jgi:two-component system LytT family response regulator
MPGKRIRAAIVDDEPPARALIRMFLASHPDVEIAGESADGADAVSMLRRERPELLFLDVRMPGADGFDVLEALDPDQIPSIIFVTAYDKYAVRAFEVRAIDYLLKPFDRERFDAALDRARELIATGRQREIGETILDLLRQQERPSRRQRIAVADGDRIRFLRLEEILWIEAQGNYVEIHTASGSHLLRETMASIEKRLAPDRFLRIHRSTIVNADHIRELQRWFRGDYKVVLNDGSELRLSQNYRQSLSALLGQRGFDDTGHPADR